MMATTALILASVIYYLCDFAFGVNDQLEIGEMQYWVLRSLVVGAAFGIVGNLAKSPRWWSLAPGLAAPTLIWTVKYPSGSSKIQPWPETIAEAIAIVMAIALVLRWLSLRAKTRSADR